MTQHQENAIAELETLAVVIAMKLWAPTIRSQHVVFCLDNDVSRFGLIKGYSNAPGVTSLVRLASVICEENMVLPWFLRVASPSNIADFPSRLQRHFLLNTRKMIAPNDVHGAFNMCWSLCIEPINEWGDPWVRTNDGSATPFQLRKKVLQFSVISCAFCLWSLSACAVFYYVFIYMRCLRDECVSYFRLWHVYLRTTYDG